MGKNIKAPGVQIILIKNNLMLFTMNYTKNLN